MWIFNRPQKARSSQRVRSLYSFYCHDQWESLTYSFLYYRYVDNLEKRCKKMEQLLTRLTNTSLSDLESNDFKLSPQQTDSSQEDEQDESDQEIENRLSTLNLSDYDSATYTGQSASFNTLIDPQLFENKTWLSWPNRQNVALQLSTDNELILVRPSKLDIGLSTRTSLENKSKNRSKRRSPQDQEPDQQLIDKMIAVYFSHIHEFMPVVNRDTFSLQTSPPILIYSMLAVSFQFAMLHLGEPKSAFGQLYLHKAMKRLKDSYRSRLSYVQAALLLTLYLDMNDEEEDCASLQWHTLGTAIRMALDLGLHRSCAHWNIPASEIDTRHRTFYACYFLDRWLSARAGKPLTLLDRYFDTPLPQTGYPAFTCMVRIAELMGRVLKAMYAPKSKDTNENAGLDDFTILDVLYRRIKLIKSLWDDLPVSQRGKCSAKLSPCEGILLTFILLFQSSSWYLLLYHCSLAASTVYSPFSDMCRRMRQGGNCYSRPRQPATASWANAFTVSAYVFCIRSFPIIPRLLELRAEG